MTFDEWFDYYSPMPNPEGESGFCVDGISYMYDLSGKDLRVVSAAAAKSPQTIWTLVEGDDGTLYVIDGFRRVNRIGFFITERANDGESVSVRCDQDDELVSSFTNR